jgi:hypothetical protein
MYNSPYRIVCGGKWTGPEAVRPFGQWVVVGPWEASWGTFNDVVLYDPFDPEDDSYEPFIQMWDCRDWIKKQLEYETFQQRLQTRQESAKVDE